MVNKDSNFSINGKYFYVLISVVLFAFLFLTRHHLSLLEATDIADANDVLSYLKISEAAPGFPVDKIAYHFSQRFIPHYSVGMISHYLSLSLDTVYTLVNALTIFLILMFSARIILKKSRGYLGMLMLAFVTISPFALRLNIFVPGLLADMIFVLGFVITLNAIIDKKIFFIIFGMILASAGKQMSLLVLPGILLYIYVNFKDSISHIRIAVINILLIVSVVLFSKWLTHFSSGFAFPNSITGQILFAIFPWMASDAFSAKLMLEHLSRIFFPSFPFLGFLFFYGIKKSNSSRRLENAALLLMVLGPAAYAFLPGPVVQMGNQGRYIASVLLPMALFTLGVMPEFELRFKKTDCIVVGIILTVYSYHHIYCILPSTRLIFSVLHLLSLISLFGWLKSRQKKIFIPLDQ